MDFLAGKHQAHFFIKTTNGINLRHGIFKQAVLQAMPEPIMAAESLNTCCALRKMWLFISSLMASNMATGFRYFLLRDGLV
jgi:hypothetical protein